MDESRRIEMTNKDNGGPAFPCDYEGSTRSDASGLSIRDYFAAKAMQGIISGGGLGFMGWHPSNWDSSKGLVKSAYEIADAMLLERNK